MVIIVSAERAEEKSPCFPCNRQWSAGRNTSCTEYCIGYQRWVERTKPNEKR
jgi:hypothetical protein